MIWTIARAPDQSAKTVLITGANSGIGLQAALALAGRGARILLACRSADKAASAVAAVSAKATGPQPRAVALDLADLASVRGCADELLAHGQCIDVLMLNAGVMAMPRSHTTDGFETHFGTNHLGHFAFAGLIMPLVLAARAPRLVITSSLAHRVGRIRWHDPNWSSRFYSATLAYGRSKLANLLFMREVDRRARAAGIPLVAAAAHPGGAHTNLAHEHATPIARSTYELMRRYTQPAEQGALPLLYAATERVAGGSFWGPDGRFEFRGGPAPAGISKTVRSATNSALLWDLSERLTGVRWEAPLLRAIA